MHATEGSSSYLSAPSEYVGYRKVILPGEYGQQLQEAKSERWRVDGRWASEVKPAG